MSMHRLIEAESPPEPGPSEVTPTAKVVSIGLSFLPTGTRGSACFPLLHVHSPDSFSFSAHRHCPNFSFTPVLLVGIQVHFFKWTHETVIYQSRVNSWRCIINCLSKRDKWPKESQIERRYLYEELNFLRPTMVPQGKEEYDWWKKIALSPLWQGAFCFLRWVPPIQEKSWWL